VAKLVDARDLKSLGLGCAGSIPAARTSHFIPDLSLVVDLCDSRVVQRVAKRGEVLPDVTVPENTFPWIFAGNVPALQHIVVSGHARETQSRGDLLPCRKTFAFLASNVSTRGTLGA
jgi:hypothetical protein